MYADLNINVNFSSKSFYKELQNSRICVSNSNQTVLLETLNLNFPTIIYFDSKFDELKKSVIPYYNILKDSKIFFEDSVKAAIHINDIWDNVDDWWQSKKVQNAVNLFCIKFSKRATNFKLHRFLNELNSKKSDVQSGEII
jgi:putative transferase (TIGR04331 family)